MLLARNDLFSELFQDMNRVQDNFASLFRVPQALRSISRGTAPAINIWEDDHNFYVESDIPNVDPSKLEIMIKEGNQLTIQGERQAPNFQNAVWLRQERPQGEFLRIVTLPIVVDSDRVEAQHENGVLKLKLPKSAAALPKKISVESH